MTIQTWLETLPAAEFLQQYYGRLPYSSAGGADSVRALGSWEALDAILRQPGVDVMVVRQGQRLSVAAPASVAEARQLLAEGATVLVRHAERHDPRLGELARGLAERLAGPVNVHVYATPAGQFGFGWHYDAEEVFILQTEGRKEYSLRKNTVHPWPVVETLPADMQFERESMPLIKCLLAAGDLLYIPSGYWHVAEARDEDALSLAVGVLAPTPLDLFDLIRRRLPQSILWRQRLALHQLDDAEPPQAAQQRLRTALELMADDLQRTLHDPDLPGQLLDAWKGKTRS